MKKLSFDHYENGVFYSVPPKLFIEIPQLKTHSERLNFLKDDHIELFNILEDLKQSALSKKIEEQEIKKKIEKAFSQFKPLGDKSSLCVNKIKSGYQCITCKQHKEIIICEDCFDLEKHRDHNWIAKKLIIEELCDCSFCDQNLCNKHEKQKNFYDIICPDVQLWTFIIFCSDLFMFLSQNFDCNITQKLFLRELARFLKLSQLHRSATIYCLVMKESPENTDSWSILGFLETQEISWLLLDYGPLLILCLERSFFHNFSEGSMAPWLCKSHKLMIEFSKNLKLCQGQSFNSAFDKIFQYLPIGDITVEIGRSYLEICQNLFKTNNQYFKKWLTSQSILRWEIYRILADDLELLRVVLLNEINFNFSNESEWYNRIVRCVLRAVKGDIQSFSMFFEPYDKKIISKFVQTYFEELYRTRIKAKFNNLTIVCLYRLSKAMGNLNLLPDELHNIQARKFAMNLTIFLRNLIATEHTTYSKIHEIAIETGNKELQNICQKEICEWFRDFLFTETEVSQSRIKSLMDQKIINFPEAITVLHENTRYIHSRKVFLFTGPSREVNSDIVLCHIGRKEEIYGLKHEQFDGLFHTEEREEILNALFKEGPLKVDFEHYRSISEVDKYCVNMTAVICNNILRGKNEHLANYINKLIKINMTFKTKSPLLNRLYETPKIIPHVSHKNDIQMEEVLVQDFLKEQEAIVSESHALKNEQNLNESIDGNNIQQKEEIVIESEPEIMKESSIIEMHPLEEPKVKKFFSDEKEHLRAQKLRKINEKFQKKTIKYTESIPQKQEQEEHCLICRECFCEKKKFLVYLASIKYDDIAQLLFGTNGQRIITSCFHPYHQGCLSQIGKNSCVLCKFEGNMILPVLSCDSLSEYYTSVWWNDFLSLTDFEPTKQQPSYYSYYYHGNSPEVQKQEEKNAMKSCCQKEGENWLENFLMIWESCVLRLGPLASFKEKKEINRSNEYFYKLIKFYYHQTDTRKKKKIVKAVSSNLKTNQSNSPSRTSDYAKDLIRVASQAFLLHIQAKNENRDGLEKIKEEVKQIISKYSLSFTNNFLSNIESLLEISILPNTSPTTFQLTPSHKFFLQNFTPSIPKNMTEVYRLRSLCPQCKITSKWICLFCLNGVCGGCCSLESHMKEKHNSGLIFAVEVIGGKGIWKAKSVSIFEGEMYFDEIFNKFEEKAEQLDRFIYCEEIGIKVFEEIIKIF